MISQNRKTKIFLDSGDPAETTEALSLLGFLDGQTTNPSLVAKNPNTAGKKFSKDDLFIFYKNVVGQVSHLIPHGSVSIEVYADSQTTAENMMEQARTLNSWVNNAHIKFPTTKAGLEAAEQAVKEGIRVNMTLVFSQAQAAAVYEATKGADRGEVFISPFIGRLDDRGENGMDLIKNILKMYEQGDGHVLVLTASVRSPGHFLEALRLKSDIITAPLKVLKEWAGGGLKLPDENFIYKPDKLTPIPYQEIVLGQSWQSYNLQHELTETGLKKFAEDWNKLTA